MFLLTCEDLADDLLRLDIVSLNLLEPSEENMLPTDVCDVLESLESISCSGIASDSLLDISEDQRLEILALESIDLCPIISYFLEEVEYEDILVTECLLSFPISIDESLEKTEYLDDIIEGLLSPEYFVNEESSLGCSGSGEGVADRSGSGEGVGASGDGEFDCAS